MFQQLLQVFYISHSMHYNSVITIQANKCTQLYYCYNALQLLYAMCTAHWWWASEAQNMYMWEFGVNVIVL